MARARDQGRWEGRQKAELEAGLGAGEMGPLLRLQAVPPASCLPPEGHSRSFQVPLTWPETHDSQSSPTGGNAQKETESEGRPGQGWTLVLA